MNVEEMKKMDHKKKVRIGILMGVLCALFWGIWYIPGYAVYNLEFLDQVWYNVYDYCGSEDTAGILQALFLTSVNAIACALVLFVWNGGLGKVKEMKRTVVQFNSASKYFLMAGACGACAVFGTYLAALFLSPGFAAIAGLLYPIVGTTLSVLVLKQKVSKRGYMAIVVLLIGGITLYSGSLMTGGAGGSIVGIIGGLMAAIGWGCEGAVAGKALDVCEPDVGLHLRFCFEAMIWIIILIVLGIIGYPMFATFGLLLDPASIIVVLLLGFSFAWCYVCWYKAFPMIGVPRGQAVGSLYAACAVIFLCIFFGPANALGYDDSTFAIIAGTTVVGLIICLFGSYLLASEDAEGLVSLKGGDDE